MTTKGVLNDVRKQRSLTEKIGDAAVGAVKDGPVGQLAGAAAQNFMDNGNDGEKGHEEVREDKNKMGDVDDDFNCMW